MIRKAKFSAEAATVAVLLTEPSGHCVNFCLSAITDQRNCFALRLLLEFELFVARIDYAQQEYCPDFLTAKN